MRAAVNPLTHAKNATWRIFNAIAPFAAALSFVGMTIVVVVGFHEVNVAQAEAKYSASEAAALAVTVARNQIIGHDLVVKGCIQTRDAETTEADGDLAKANNDHELALLLGKINPKIAQVLNERERVERDTSLAIRGDLTALCQYEFDYPPAVKKAK